MDVAILTPLLPRIPWDWSPVCLEDLKSCLVLGELILRLKPAPVKVLSAEWGILHGWNAALRSLLSSCPQAL